MSNHAPAASASLGSQNGGDGSEHKSADCYQEAWREYKRRRNACIYVYLGYMPFVGFVAFLSIRLLHTFVPAFITALFWMGLLVFITNRFSLWRCPRCGKCFAGTWWYNLGAFARRCVHCGLLKHSR